MKHYHYSNICRVLYVFLSGLLRRLVVRALSHVTVAQRRYKASLASAFFATSQYVQNLKIGLQRHRTLI